MANTCILCMNIPCHSTIRNVTVSAQAYYTQIWRPYKIKYIKLFECIQRRVTKFILQDFQSVYISRLTNLHLFPLSLWFEYLTFSQRSF